MAKKVKNSSRKSASALKEKATKKIAKRVARINKETKPAKSASTKKATTSKNTNTKKSSVKNSRSQFAAPKPIQRKVKQEPNKLQSLLNSVNGIFWEADAQTFEFNYVSNQAERILGYPTSDWTTVKTFWADHIHEQDRDSTVQYCIACTARLESHDFEYRMIAKDGREVWLHDIVTVESENGKPVLLHGFMVDITKRKQAEEGQRAAQEKLDLFFTQSLDGFFFMMLDEPVEWNETIDKEKTLEYVFSHQRITRVNDAMLNQYLATADQFMNLTPNDLMAHDLDDGKKVWRKFFDLGKLHIETKEKKFDGSEMFVEGDYICMYDSEKRIVGHFGIQRDVTMRVKLDQELINKSKELTIAKEKAEESENKLNEAQRLAKIGSWDWDLATSKISWSDNQYVIWGHSKHDFIPGYDAYINQLSAEDRKISDDAVKTALEKSGIFEVEHEIIRPDGSKIFVVSRGEVKYDINGKPYRIIGTSQDITAQKLAEKEIEKMALIAKHTHNLIVITDAHRKIEWVNHSFEILTGYTLAEAVGKNPAELLQGPETDKSINQLVREKLNRGEIAEFEILNYSKSGEKYWLEIEIQPIYDERGVLMNFIAIELNITEKKLAEDLLKQQAEEIQKKNDQLVSISENIPNGATHQLIIDNQGNRRFTFISASIEALTGLTVADILADAALLYAQTHPDDVDALRQAEEQSIINLTTFTHEFRNIDKNGTVRWLQICTKPRAIDQGVLFDGFAFDITEQKLLTDTLIKKEAELKMLNNNLPDSAVIYQRVLNKDGTQRSSYYSDSIKNLLGIAPEVAEKSQEYIFDLMPTEHHAEFRHSIEPFDATPSHFEYDFNVKLKSGISKIVHASSQPVHLADGAVVWNGILTDITQKKRDELKIKETEERLLSISKNLPNVVIFQFSKSPDGKLSFPFLSESVFAITGRTAEEIMHTEFTLENIHPTDRGRFMTAVGDSATNLSEFDLRWQNRHQNGEYRVIQAYAKPKKLPNNTVQWDGLLIDRTETSKLTKQLEFTYFTLNQTSDLILWIRKDSSLLNVNPSTCNQLGYSMEELLKMSKTDFDLSYTSDSWQRHWNELAAAKTLTFESVYTRKDKSTFPVEVNANFIFFEGEEYNCAIVRDISKWKGDQKILEESETRFRNLVIDIQVGVMLQGPSAEIILCNNECYNLLGLTEDQLLGKTSFDPEWNVVRTDGSNFPAPKHPVQMAIQTLKPVKGVMMGVYRPTTKDRVWLQVDAHPILKEDGTLRHVICTFLDVTTEHEHQLGLQKNIVEKEMLIKEIHHRVKNNLQLISSILFIRSNKMESGSVKVFLEETRQKIKSISLIHERLLFAEEINRVQMKDYINNLIHDIGAYSTNPVNAIHLRAEIDPIIMDVDKAMYCGLIVNELVTNAIKYAFQHVKEGIITVKLVSGNGQTTLQVSDSGSSLPAHVVVGQKTSFGMQLLEVFVQQLKATIEIDRVNGTTFTIRFNTSDYIRSSKE